MLSAKWTNEPTGAHKVGDGSFSKMSSGARQGYLTNANPPLFSCTWGGLGMQWVCIQILCAQAQPSPFEIPDPNASSLCCNAWSLGLRGSEGAESLSAVPRPPGDSHRAGKALQTKWSSDLGVQLWSHDCLGLGTAWSHLQVDKTSKLEGKCSMCKRYCSAFGTTSKPYWTWWEPGLQRLCSGAAITRNSALLAMVLAFSSARAELLTVSTPALSAFPCRPHRAEIKTL